MRYIQSLAALVLLVSLILIYQINSKNQGVIQVIAIEEDGFENTNLELVDALTKSLSDHTNIVLKRVPLSYAKANNFRESLNKISEQDVIVGCLTLTCQLILLDYIRTLKTTDIPLFLILGRMPGLVQHERMWNMGSTFNQNLTPLLALLASKGANSFVLIGDDSIHAKMSLSIIKSYLVALNLTWKEEIYLANEQDISIKVSEQYESSDTIINATCGPFRTTLFEKLVKQPAIKFHLCSTPSALNQTAAENWFYANSASGRSPEDVAIKRALNVIRDLANAKSNLLNLRNYEFSFEGDDLSVLDHQTRTPWNRSYLQSGENITPLIDKIVAPKIYPDTRQPSEWDLEIVIYWRNHNGLWYNYSI